MICAVHGACLGLAMDLITAADIRMCTKDAYFNVKEVAMGKCQVSATKSNSFRFSLCASNKRSFQ